MNELSRPEKCTTCPIGEWSEEQQVMRHLTWESVYGEGGHGSQMMRMRSHRERLGEPRSYDPAYISMVSAAMDQMLRDRSQTDQDGREVIANLCEQFNLELIELYDVLTVVSEYTRLQQMDLIDRQLELIDKELAEYDIPTLLWACLDGIEVRLSSARMLRMCGSLAINETQRQKMSRPAFSD